MVLPVPRSNVLIRISVIQGNLLFITDLLGISMTETKDPVKPDKTVSVEKTVVTKPAAPIIEPKPVAGKKRKRKHPGTMLMWIGSLFLAASVLFLMGIVLISLFSNANLDYDARFLIVLIVAISMSAGLGVLGGSAAAKGTINIPILGANNVAIGLTGGIVVFLTTMYFGDRLYVKQAPGFGSSFAADNVDSLVKQYVLQYETRQMGLYRAIFASNLAEVEKLESPEAYSDFLRTYFAANPEKENDLISLTAFYESVLVCHAERILGCPTEDIDQAFGKSIVSFVNTYGPYLASLSETRYKGKFDNLIGKI